MKGRKEKNENEREEREQKKKRAQSIRMMKRCNKEEAITKELR